MFNDLWTTDNLLLAPITYQNPNIKTYEQSSKHGICGVTTEAIIYM